MCTCQTTLDPFPRAFAKLLRPVTRVTLHARNQTLHVTVATSDTTAAVSVPCTGTLPPVGVHAKSFADLIKPLRHPVSMHVEGNVLRVVSGAFNGSIPCVEVTEPPALPHHAVSAGVIGGELAFGLRRSLFCCSKQNGHRSLEGVYLRVEDRLHIISTDTHRLSITRVDGVMMGGLDCIVPATAAEVLMRLSEPDNETVRLACNKSHFFATSGTWTFSTRLLDGQFPRYAEVVPNLSQKSLRIEDKKGFLAALATVSPCGTRDTVTIEVNGTVRLAGQNGRMPVPASAFGFETVTLNAKYLKEMVKFCDDAHPMIRYSGADRPVRVDAPGWTHVLMPINPPVAVAA